MEAVTLFELQSSLKEGLADLFPERIRVRAELASVQVKAGGHCKSNQIQTTQRRRKENHRRDIKYDSFVLS